MSARSVAVHIRGEKYAIRSDADPTYVRKLASFVDSRLEEVRNTTQIVSTQKLAVLAALNIADELFQERRKRTTLKEQVLKKTETILACISKEEKKLELMQK